MVVYANMTCPSCRATIPSNSPYCPECYVYLPGNN